MSPVRVVAIAGSAGSLQGFQDIVSRLPRDFPCPILLLQHRSKRGSSHDGLVELARYWCALNVLEAQHGDELMPGTVYVSPPGRHISVTESLSVELGDGPRLDWNRPSADWLFGSLAQRLGPGVISVVLSGTRSDGAAGVLTVKRHGGRVIIQDPQTSRFADMPRASMATGCADFVLPSARISDALVTLAMVPGAMDLFSVPLPPWARLGRN